MTQTGKDVDLDNDMAEFSKGTDSDGDITQTGKGTDSDNDVAEFSKGIDSDGDMTQTGKNVDSDGDMTQTRTALEKCTHLYDDTQGTNNMTQTAKKKRRSNRSVVQSSEGTDSDGEIGEGENENGDLGKGDWGRCVVNGASWCLDVG